MVDGATGAAQLNEVPSGQTAKNCTLVVGSVSSVSGDSKSRVGFTNSVPCTMEPSAHWCGTAQKASAVSSKKMDCSAADAEVGISTVNTASSEKINLKRNPRAMATPFRRIGLLLLVDFLLVLRHGWDPRFTDNPARYQRTVRPHHEDLRPLPALATSP